MKKFLIAGSSLAVAAAGSAGAVDVTLGGSIEMGWEYGVGKKANAANGFTITPGKQFQNIGINVGVAGTTDAGLKFGGSFTMATDGELAVNLQGAAGAKKLVKLKNTSADQAIKAAAYNVSGGQQVLGGSIVSVKINSEWHEAKTSVTGLAVDVASLAGDTAICKIGGKAELARTDAPKTVFEIADGGNADAWDNRVKKTVKTDAQPNVVVERSNTAGTKVASVTKLGAKASGYMAAGRLADVENAWANVTAATEFLVAGAKVSNANDAALVANAGGVAGANGGAGNANNALAAVGDGAKAGGKAVSLTAATTAGAAAIVLDLAADDDAGPVVGGALDADLFNVNLGAATEGDDVKNAAVYAGPYAEVVMTSSTTKMVIGAVCVSADIKASETKAYLDVASRVVSVSDASVYIEGGFGKLSLSTSKYKGSVGGVGGAGDQVEVGNTGVVAKLSSVSFMGLSGSGAVDLGTVNLNQRPNYAFGTSVDLLGLTIAVEMEDEVQAPSSNTYIDKWDAATSYDLNGMSVAIATDSNNDWGMSAGYELLGFSMTSVVSNVAKGASKKSGLSIDTTFATNLNGIGLSIGLDEDLAWTIGASYSLGSGGLNMYANYSSGKGGGKMGAKMSF